MGNDGIMLASVGGRTDNLNCILDRFKTWNLDRHNTLLGSCAVGNAAYFGLNKISTFRILLERGARLDFRTYTGGTALTCAVDNPDSDPKLVELILRTYRHSNASNFKSFVNNKRQSTTLKWKSLYYLSTVLYRMGFATTGVMYMLAMDAGGTALQGAVSSSV